MDRSPRGTYAGERLVLELDGRSLTPGAVHAFVREERFKARVAPAALERVRACASFLAREADTKAIYGVTTGFGPMASHIIGTHQLAELQYNLIRSHAVGVGEPIPDAFVLAAMLDRLNTFLSGRSGVSEEIVSQLLACINERIIPVVPEHGAVGTSGDLVQLAHIALSLIGEGDVSYRGARMSAQDALRAAGLAPVALGPKEGLALINGTSVMTGIAALAVAEAENLIELALRSGALALELVRGLDDALSETLQAVRPHPGQGAVAARLRSLLASSKRLTGRSELQSRVAVGEATYETPEHIQEVYSFRCMPQILGPILDAMRRVGETVRIELNSVTDNPVIDAEQGVFLHGGNFHGDYIATAVDQLKIGLVKLTLLSERRINFFLNKNVNQTYPPFLNMQQPGLSLALQGVQFVATSTAAKSQSLAYPHSLHSIPTNADNQDVVSMGTDAALIAWQVVEHAYVVLAIELVTLAQAVDVAGVAGELGEESALLYAFVRRYVPPVVEDRSFSGELNALVAALKAGLDSHGFSIPTYE